MLERIRSNLAFEAKNKKRTKSLVGPLLYLLRLETGAPSSALSLL
jgi:hypothetical protein